MTADLFEQLKTKYQPVLDFMKTQNVELQNLNLQGNKLFVRGKTTSQEVKNKIWDQIKLVDPNYADLIADIEAPAAAAATVGGGSKSARTYTVRPGDSLSKISQQYYGSANQYMKILDANRDKLTDPDKIRPGLELIIP